MRRTPLLLLSVMALAAPALAQGKPVQREPQAGQPADTRADNRREGPQDAEEATKQINRSLQELDERRERLREALKKIQAGTPVREALRGVELRVERGQKTDAQGTPRVVRGGEPGGLAEAMGDRSSGRRLEHPPTPEQREQAKAFMRQHLPEIATRMEATEKADPERYERAMTRLVARIEEAESVRKSDPTLFALRVREIEGQIKVVEAIRADREAKDTKDQAKMDAAAVTLRAALAAQFDTRLELQEHEIQGLIKRAEELKADVQKKRSGREVSIEEMFKRVREFGERRMRERTQGEGHPKDGEPRPAEPKR